ncbi:MAG: tRNA-dependent cyclodipeptide synthase [Candidatus Paceibacterota bacterium]|jgi:tRNA-dependent cyclodipeptide synthase
MRIDKYLNTNEIEVTGKKFNIFLGLSLGNKYWTAEHIKTFLSWALEHTKEKVAILIPDKIQAVNYVVKNDYSSKRAASVAKRKGDEVEEIVRKILDETNVPLSKVEVLRWEQVEDEEYKRILDILYSEFASNSGFKKAVIDAVKDVSHLQAICLDETQYERLAKYVIDEMPVLLNGFQVNGVRYNLLPYPGLAKIDYLQEELLQNVSFPEITKQLNIQTRVGLVEAYAE